MQHYGSMGITMDLTPLAPWRPEGQISVEEETILADVLFVDLAGLYTRRILAGETCTIP